MDSSRLYLFNSKDSSTIADPTIDTHATITVAVPAIHVDGKTPKGMKVTEVLLPHSWYNIQAGVNDHFTFEEAAGGGLLDIYLSPKNYSAHTIVADLKSELDALSPNGYVYTVVLDLDTQKITIETTGLVAFDFGGDVITDSFGGLIGFVGIGAAYTGSNAYTGERSVNFIDDKYMYIISDLGQGIDKGVIPLTGATTPADEKILCAMRIDAPYGNINIYENGIDDPVTDISNTDFGNKERFGAARTLSFTLTLPNSDLVVDLNGLAWSMKIRFYYETPTNTNSVAYSHAQ
jgi:hypothetical protein